MNKFDGVTIVTGDFNLAKTCDLYQQFKQAGQWQNTSQDDHSPTYHAEFLPPGRKPQCIDYIFVRSNLNTISSARVFEQKIDGTYLSNHIGVWAKLNYTDN